MTKQVKKLSSQKNISMRNFYNWRDWNDSNRREGILQVYKIRVVTKHLNPKFDIWN